MPARILLLVCALALIATMAGCESMTRAYEWSRDTVNPPPEIDHDTSEIGDDPAERLAFLFGPVDEQVEGLERMLEVQLDYPEEEWLQKLLHDYPWVNGVLTVQKDGQVLIERPGPSMKEVDVQPLLDRGEEWLDLKPLAYIDETDLGPELYLATPFLQSRDWLGLTVAHFDPRSLMQYCPSPDQLIVLTPQVLIAPGPNPAAAEALRASPWQEILEDDINGELDADGRTFTWVSRYLGGMRIIYAVENRPGA